MITKTLILLLIIINISISDGKIFEAKLRAGKQAVTDYYDGDDVNELETKDGDTYYQCQKNCITKLDDNKCKSCTVREDDPDRPVFCRDGTLPLPCMNKCCIQIETPNERITGKQVRIFFITFWFLMPNHALCPIACYAPWFLKHLFLNCIFRSSAFMTSKAMKTKATERC